MKKIITLFTLAFATALSASAQGTAFTYQGRLSDGPNPANGFYDFTFSLYDANTNGNLIGQPLTNFTVGLTNGAFGVSLDFGPGVFSGASRWLQLAVRTNGASGFINLYPTQALLPAPYAIYAEAAGTSSSVSNAVITASALNTVTAPASGQVLSYNGSNLSWSTPAANGGLTLPYSGTASSSSSLFTLQNTGSGPAGAFLGNVGIGTAAPTAKLQIYGNSAPGPHIPFNEAVLSSGDGFNNRFMSVYGDESVYLSMWQGGYGEVSTYNYATATALPLVLNSNGGNVGIGTTAPVARLDVLTSSNNAVAITGTNTYSGVYGQLALSETIGGGDFPEDTYIGVYGNNGSTSPTFYFGDYAGYFDGDVNINGSSFLDGNVSVTGAAVISGSTSATEMDTVNNFSGTPTTTCIAVNGTAQSGVGVNGNGYIGVLGSTVNIPYGRGVLGSAFGGANSWGGLFTYGSTGSNAAYLGGNGAAAIFYGPVTVEGTTTVQVLTITGGSDVAEPFDLSTKDIPKGSVVVIDEDAPGQLKLSGRPYDSRVAGIVSGANGINPGLSLHQQGKMEGGENVALSGRVYALADATFGAIKPGDLLTTSGTPGHCMKVTDHRRAQGAVIGKAMSSLENGKGTVLVLITLQ